MVRGVQQAEDPAEAVPEQVHLIRSRRPADLPDGRGQHDVGVVLELVRRIALVRGSPVEQVHVEARAQQPLDEAVSRGEVEDVAAAHEAEHDQQRRAEPDLVVAVAPQLAPPMTPDDVLRGQPDTRARRAGRQLDPVAGPQRVALDLTANPVQGAARIGQCRHRPSPPSAARHGPRAPGSAAAPRGPAPRSAAEAV